MPSNRVVLPRPGAAEVEQFDPPPLAADQVLIKTHVSLISPGTERACLLNLPNTPVTFPHQPGYSNVGEVAAVGEAVTGLAIGQRVGSRTGHASHAITNASQCVPVPADVPDEDAVFLTLGAIALNGVRKARIEIGESVAVIGAGVVGLLALQLGKLNGAAPSICVDKEERRLAFARNGGADAVVIVDDDVSKKIGEICGSDGADVIIEASGNPHAIPLAFQLTRKRGRTVLLGSTRGNTETNFYRDVHVKGLTVIGAHTNARPQHSEPGWWTLVDDQRVILKLLSLQRFNVAPILTHRFPWREAPRAYELLLEGKAETQGILIDWR